MRGGTPWRNLPLLTPAEDADDDANPFGRDQLAALNIHELALGFRSRC